MRATSGQLAVRQAISPATLGTIFGSAGKGMSLIVGETVLDIDRQIKAMVPADLLELPFGNLALGRPRDCLARDVNEVFDIAMRLSTAFSMSMFGAATSERGSHSIRRSTDSMCSVSAARYCLVQRPTWRSK